jgi:hypothetical protein
MDDVQVSLDSPQEDEFALLALGARSPYEGLMFPSQLARALSLSDPDQLSGPDLARWREVFQYFLRCVSVSAGSRPLILKSPPHGSRIAMLRELVPEARFVLIVRSPEVVFESAVGMWKSLCALYALEPLPTEDYFRAIVLEDRLRFEAKLGEGLQALPPGCLAFVRYEELVRGPVQVVGSLYDQLGLGGFAEVEPSIRAQARAKRQYQARQAAPDPAWAQRVRQSWESLYTKYGYA